MAARPGLNRRHRAGVRPRRSGARSGVAERVPVVQNGDNVAAASTHEMTAAALRHIIRDGGRDLGRVAAPVREQRR
ncbi:MAG TPA: hypothetical protein VFV80_11810 [Geminicoccaceae bacterium]|nr:hypothetical protein [Geminicoccaceae bacterium]